MWKRRPRSWASPPSRSNVSGDRQKPGCTGSLPVRIRMTAERWQQVKAIFDRAVECDPPAREEFIRASCGNDEELRREVESLMASDRDAGSLLEHPVLPAGPQ